MRGALLKKATGAISCLLLLFKSRQNERLLVRNALSLHWIIGFVEFLSLWSEFTTIWGFIFQIILTFSILLDLTLLVMSMVPELFGEAFRIKKGDLLITLPVIEEFLVYYAVLKSVSLAPLAVLLANSVDQAFVVCITLVSAFNVALTLRSISGTDSILANFKEKSRLLISLISSFIFVMGVQLAKPHYSGEQDSMKAKCLGLLSVLLLVVFNNRGWIKTVHNILKEKQSENANNWSNWNHFHLPVIVLNQDYAIPYSNKAAKEFFASITKDRIKDFCEQLVEAGSPVGITAGFTLSRHLDYLFTLLNDISAHVSPNGNSRQHISSVKEYVLFQDNVTNPFCPLVGRRTGEIRYQIEVFEAGKTLQPDEYLVLVLNENVSASDYRELKQAKQKIEAATGYMANAIMCQATNMVTEAEGLSVLTGDSRSTTIMLSAIKRLKASIASWQEIVKAHEGTFMTQAKEIKVEEFFSELKELYEPVVRSKGGDFVCEYEPIPSTWNIDYSKIKGLVVNSLNIGLLHLDHAVLNKQIKVSAKVADKKVGLSVTYPASNLLDDTLEEERVLFFVCQEILTKMNGTMVKPNPPAEEYSLEASECSIHFEIVTGTINAMNRGFSVIEDSQDPASFIEINEHEEIRPSRQNLLANRKSLFSMASKRSIKSSEREPRRVPSKIVGETSFGCIPMITAERSEIYTEIPEEFPEGTDKASFQKHLTVQYNFLEKFMGNNGAGLLYDVFGLVIFEDQLMIRNLVKTLTSEGVNEVLTVPNLAIQEEIKIKEGRVIAIYVDVCNNTVEQIKDFLNLKAIMEREYVLIGIRCGQCRICEKLKEDIELRRVLHAVYEDVEHIPALSALLQSFVTATIV